MFFAVNAAPKTGVQVGETCRSAVRHELLFRFVLFSFACNCCTVRFISAKSA